MQDGELPEDEVVPGVLFDAGDSQCAVVDGVTDVGPIFVTFDTTSLHDRGQHDDQGGLTFPSHVPEIRTCGGKRALGSNVPEN